MFDKFAFISSIMCSIKVKFPTPFLNMHSQIGIDMRLSNSVNSLNHTLVVIQHYLRWYHDINSHTCSEISLA